MEVAEWNLDDAICWGICNVVRGSAISRKLKGEIK